MNEINDDELRRRFAALRNHETSLEPDFETMRHRALSWGTRANTFALPARWIASAGCIVIAAAVVVATARDENGARRTITEAPAITGWQSPTASLLQTPATSVLVPRPLLSSVFDGVTARLQLKTD